MTERQKWLRGLWAWLGLQLVIVIYSVVDEFARDSIPLSEHVLKVLPFCLAMAFFNLVFVPMYVKMLLNDPSHTTLFSDELVEAGQGNGGEVCDQAQELSEKEAHEPMEKAC